MNELSDRVGLARRVLSEMITVKAGPRRAGELAARRLVDRNVRANRAGTDP